MAARSYWQLIAVRRRLDAGRLGLRLGHRARRSGSLIGTIRTTDKPWMVRFGNAWVGALPQHTAAGADVPVVLRRPRVHPAAEALDREHRSGECTVCAPRCCASACSPRRALPSRFAPGSSRCRAASATPAWRSASTQPQVYRFVLLPMGFRIIIPPLTSETMNLIKNSSIALTIGLAELTFRARELGEYTFNFFEAFTRGDADLYRHRDDRQSRHGGDRAADGGARQ